MKDKLILSFYIDIRGLGEASQVGEYLEQVKGVINSQLDSDGKGDVVAFYFPIEGESKVECINPVLVTEQDAIDRFNESIERLNALNEELKNKIDQKENGED